ncbi:SDR family NAD(P)-dependent oxidoreductase [Microbacter margulisiae]|uniref:3-oxoacyl-[acyl-carrier protein] reductase n=1 Tax=Microbacter margulisiae TaxID=1350067 RepID=A0A7W5DQJ8_9PORP|nr:SDR family oxidoreductase [Microbacter margulisiae]MBB3187240.1 3-oxoacyl-[acyl-carrier protein] reductase [Microbacter margulisiae]
MSRSALIIGGTKGIGKSLSERLLQENYLVVATYASDCQAADAVCSAFATSYPNHFFVLQADSSSLDSIDVIASFLEQHRLMPEVVVFNAGMTDRSSFLEIKIDNWQKIFMVNIHFPTFLLQKIFPVMKRGGNVIFTGSLMGIHPHSLSLGYGVTKAAVHALVKNLVKFLEEREIRVNAVAPGFVDTEWQKNKPADIRQNITRKMTAGRFCEPDELIDVYMLLIQNRYMNGEIIVCDGGYGFR